LEGWKFRREKAETASRGIAIREPKEGGKSRFWGARKTALQKRNIP
jgi:hypothetical protein